MRTFKSLSLLPLNSSSRTITTCTRPTLVYRSLLHRHSVAPPLSLLPTHYYCSDYNNNCFRWYHSRAHPQPRPLRSLPTALSELLRDVNRRNRRRRQHLRRRLAPRTPRKNHDNENETIASTTIEMITTTTTTNATVLTSTDTVTSLSDIESLPNEDSLLFTSLVNDLQDAAVDTENVAEFHEVATLENNVDVNDSAAAAEARVDEFDSKVLATLENEVTDTPDATGTTTVDTNITVMSVQTETQEITLDTPAVVLQDATASETIIDTENATATTHQTSVPIPVQTMDETIELAVSLNVDPRKPGQSLRGSLPLPHGTGKTIGLIVFTDSADLRDAALRAGAAYAGGAITDAHDDTLLSDLLNGKIGLGTLQRAIATSKHVVPLLQKTPGLARLLGPRGLLPNPKDGTVLDIQNVDELTTAVATRTAGQEVAYKTEKEGIIHVPVGRASFGPDRITENIGAVLKELLRIKPEQYGKGKKSGKGKKAVGKGTPYVLRASVSATQGKGIRLDARTVDPSSPFFLSTLPEENRAQQLELQAIKDRQAERKLRKKQQAQLKKQQKREIKEHNDSELTTQDNQTKSTSLSVP